MYNIKLIQHVNVTKLELEEIIRIKTVAWNFPFTMQLKWISENIKETDFHLLLLENDKAVAYLNLISIELLFDTVSYSGFGVGNVCAIQKGNGYGVELMRLTNQFIINENKIGLLFCKTSLINFYIRSNWKMINNFKLKLSFNNDNINVMLFNFNMPFDSLVYNESVF